MRRLLLLLLLLPWTPGCVAGGSAEQGRGSWRPLPAEGAPPGATSASAVWTGTQMVVFGGTGGCGGTGVCGGGARYLQAGDRWLPLATAGAPGPRYLHAAVWSGARMLVFGGRGCGPLAQDSCADGGAYDPASDGWTPLAALAAPAARGWHTAVWTGAEMIVWGGEDGASVTLFGDGARYRPDGDAWAALPAEGAPSPRRYHTAVWTGAEMIVWGGDGSARPYLALGDGARYHRAHDAWAKVTAAGAPSARYAHSAVWTGTEMLVFGGLGCGQDGTGDPAACGDGARYDPSRDRWTPMAAGPVPRSGHSAVWTGTEMIVWGGASAACRGGCGDGASYDPSSDRWTPLATAGAPSPRSGQSAVWTGAQMILWGGSGEVSLQDGAVFSP